MSTVDFAILTGLTEEFEVLQKIVPGFQEVPSESDVDIWYRTRVDSENEARSYEVVAAFQDQMGPLSAHNLTTKMIERWDPAYIIVVGIAGSFHKEVRLGDVVVSQQIFYYDPGKATSGGIQYRPEGYPCSVVLVKQLEALRLDKEMLGGWQQAQQKSAASKARKLKGRDKAQSRKDLREYRPKIHFGTVASGSQVIATKKKQKELLSLHGKIIGTEMEGAGVLHAAHYNRELPVPAIVIKGISDAADENKVLVDAEGHWRELAKESPVRLVLELIRRGRIRPLQTDQFYLDTTPGSFADARRMIPGASALPVSYQAFPRLVMPRGPLTEIKIGVEVYGKDGPLPLNIGIVRYQDHKGNQKTMEMTGLKPKIHLTESILAVPIEVYTRIQGTPTRMVFTVASPRGEQKTEWFPNRQEHDRHA